MPSLLTSIEISQGEKNLAKEAIDEFNRFLNIFDFVFIDVKKLNNAIINFPKKDPGEFKKRRKDFANYKRWLDSCFKAFAKSLIKTFKKIDSVKDGDIENIKSGIFINLDNLIELGNKIYNIFEVFPQDFREQIGKAFFELISRSEDFRRMIKEDLILHLSRDVIGTKYVYSNKQQKRIAQWDLLSTVTI